MPNHETTRATHQTRPQPIIKLMSAPRILAALCSLVFHGVAVMGLGVAHQLTRPSPVALAPPPIQVVLLGSSSSVSAAVLNNTPTSTSPLPWGAAKNSLLNRGAAHHLEQGDRKTPRMSWSSAQAGSPARKASVGEHKPSTRPNHPEPTSDSLNPADFLAVSAGSSAENTLSNQTSGAVTTAPTMPRIDADWSGNIPPTYPFSARRLGEEGEVRLDIHVGADGTVLDVRIKQSSGSVRLDRSAVEAIRRWRFIPARHADIPIAAWYHNWRWIFKLEG